MERVFNFPFSKSNYWNFDYWQEVESRYKFKSIFYVYSKIKFGLRQIILDPSYDISINNKLIEKLIEIKKEGWHIGLHGSFYSYNNFNLMKAEKNQLEDKLKFEINKNRQHWLNYDERLTQKFHQELFEGN